MSESTTEQSSREQEREALRDARYFVELYARRNPRFEHDGEMQDPSGVNACLERIDAVLARPTMLLQDENSGREGRRYNEWHASRPDARLNAREAVAALFGITAEEAGREGDAKDAARWRRLVNASEMDFPVATIADDPENGCTMLYGRQRLEKYIESLDEISDKYELPPAPAQSGGQGNG